MKKYLSLELFKFIIMVIALIFLAVVVLFLLYAVSIYNNLVKLKNLVQEAWSSIDVMLKKRYDLIPNFYLF